MEGHLTRKDWEEADENRGKRGIVQRKQGES